MVDAGVNGRLLGEHGADEDKRDRHLERNLKVGLSLREEGLRVHAAMGGTASTSSCSGACSGHAHHLALAAAAGRAVQATVSEVVSPHGLERRTAPIRRECRLPMSALCYGASFGRIRARPTGTFAAAGSADWISPMGPKAVDQIV